MTHAWQPTSGRAMRLQRTISFTHIGIYTYTSVSFNIIPILSNIIFDMYHCQTPTSQSLVGYLRLPPYVAVMPSSILISWSIRSCIWIISSLAAFKASDLALQHGFVQHSGGFGLFLLSGDPALCLCTFLCQTLTTSLLWVNCTAYIMSVILVIYPVRPVYLPFLIITLSPQLKGCCSPFNIIFIPVSYHQHRLCTWRVSSKVILATRLLLKSHPTAHTASQE
jgi:hypothetical protein